MSIASFAKASEHKNGGKVLTEVESFELAFRAVGDELDAERQATGSVMVTMGNTSVLCTVVAEQKAKAGQAFFPLSVHYIEKTYSVGKIPGGFFKREGRPSEKETLTSRLIDRPIRPLFPDGFRNETQVICTVVAHDLENDPDVVSLVGADLNVRVCAAFLLERAERM